MPETQTLFHAEGELFTPTEAAGNPWGELTGGGPIAGLLARAAESAVSDPELLVTRMTVDLMRPVPRTPLSSAVRFLRTGKRLQVVEAVLHQDGTEVSRAVVQLARRSEVAEESERAPVPFAGPEGVEDGSLLPPGLGLLPGVHDIVRARWLADQASEHTSQVWMRLPVALVPGEEPSPLVRTAVLVDCISAASPIGTLFGPWINTDITLYLQRPLEGDWLGMQIQRDVEPTGVGVARAELFDEQGPIGLANEAVLAHQLG